MNANGLYLSCTSGTTYSISENSTAVGALRGYSTGTAYRGIYLFKLTSVTSGASTVTFYTTQFAGVCTHETLNATPYHAPTCTEPGNTAYWTCASCGKFFSDAAGTVEIDENSWILPATDHAYGAWTPNNDGTHSRVCAYDATHIETAACTFDDGAVTVAATYTAPGVKTYTCSVCGYSYTEAIPQLVYAESAAFKLTDMLTDGDKIVIYNPASGKALTSTLTGGYYLAGADATVNDTLLTAEDSAAVWTVKDNGDGTFSFVQDNGIALYGYISGSYVDLANTTGDGYVNKWVVNEVDSANHKFSMRCDGLSYTKSGTTYNSVYLEYFSNHFALYGNNNTLTVSDTAYLMQFYVLTAEVKGVSLTLNGNINTNAYLAIPDELVGDTLVAVVTYTDENGDTVTVSETALDPADKAPNGLYCFTAEMPAKDMNTKVRVTLLDGDGNPVPFLNSLGATVDYYEYSVQDYLKQVLETEADYYSANYPALVALCKTMRAYGYYAQLLFDYDTSNLVAPDANYLDGINVTATYTASVTKGTNVRFYGASLILRSQTAIRAYFVITGDASGYKAYIDGSTTGVELTQYAPGSRYYYVEVADIHARDLYQTHTIEVSNGTDSASLNNYSVYCYIARSVGDGDSLARLVKALWAYGEEARDYFS